jgi:hypothetical protein
MGHFPPKNRIEESLRRSTNKGRALFLRIRPIAGQNGLLRSRDVLEVKYRKGAWGWGSMFRGMEAFYFKKTTYSPTIF